MEIPITQSKAWEKLQEDLGETSYYREGKDFSYLAIVKPVPLGSYLYLPYGPVADAKDGFKSALEDIKNLAREENAVFVRIEPRNRDFTKFSVRTTKNTNFSG